MTGLPIGFRVVIRSADNTRDDLVVSSVGPDAGDDTNRPYLTEPPSIDGASADLIAGTVDVGAGTVRFWDEYVAAPVTYLTDDFRNQAAFEANWTPVGEFPPGWQNPTIGVGGDVPSSSDSLTVLDASSYRERTLTGLPPNTQVQVRLWQRADYWLGGPFSWDDPRVGLRVATGDPVVPYEFEGWRWFPLGSYPPIGVLVPMTTFGTTTADGELVVQFGFFDYDFTGASGYIGVRQTTFDRIEVEPVSDGAGRIYTRKLHALRDGTPRLTQLSRVARFDQTRDGGDTWAPLHTGYVNRADVDGGEWTLTVGDTTRQEQQAELFATLPLVDPATLTVPLPMPAPRVGLILGGPIVEDPTYGKFADVEDFGPTRWQVDEQHDDQGPDGTTRVLRLKFKRGYLRPWYQKVWTSFAGSDSRLDNDGNESDERDYVNKAVDPYFQWDPKQFASPVSATVQYFGFFPDLVAQLTPVGGGTVLEATPIARPIRFESGNREKPKGEYDALVGNDSTMYLAWGDQAWPGIGTQFDITLFSRRSSESNPVLLAGHPVDLLAYAAALIGVPIDDATRVACKAALGAGLWHEGMYGKQKFTDFTHTLCSTFRFLFRVDVATGLRQFVPIGPRPPSTFTITHADRVSASDDGASQPPVFEVAEDSVVNVVTFETQAFRRYRFKEDGTDPPPHMIASTKSTLEGARGDTSVNGDRTVTFSVPGQILVRAADGSTSPQPRAYFENVGGAIIDFAGWGVAQTVVLVDAESAAASAQVGDEGTLDLPDLPVPIVGATPMTTRGAGPRVVRVVKRTPSPGAVELTLVQAGELSQDAVAAPTTGGSTATGTPTAPTLTLAASTAAPTTVATVTLTNGATLATDNLRTELEWLAQAATPASTDDGTLFGPVTVYPAGDATTVDVPAQAPGSKVWVRALTRNTASGVASALTTWASVTLTAAANGQVGTVGGVPVTIPAPTLTPHIVSSALSIDVRHPSATTVKLATSTTGPVTASSVRAASATTLTSGAATIATGVTPNPRVWVAAYAYDAAGNESQMASALYTAADAATASALGLVEISGTPTDPTHPVVYVVEAVDAFIDDHETRIADLEAAGGGGGGGGSGGSAFGRHLYWRIKATASPHTYVEIAEIQFRSVPGGTNRATGGTATSSAYIAPYPPANAFDGNTATLCLLDASLPGSIAYQFTTAVAVAEVMLRSTGDELRFPTQFRVEYSDVGGSSDANWSLAWAVTTASPARNTDVVFTDPDYGGTGGTGTGSFVSSFNTRVGVVTPATGDYSASQITGLGTAATLDVPASGNASSSQVVKGNDTRLAGTAPTGTAGGDLTGTYPNPTLATVGTAGTYKSVTTDSKGRVTGGTNPTTLAGYGITDAAALSHTHTASQISDSTTAGRAILTAADASAQRTALGLGTAATGAAPVPATASVLGLLKISGTPTDAANPVTYTKEAVDALIAAITAGAAAGAAEVLIAEWIADGTTGTHTFSSIAATYRDLRVAARGRVDAAVNSANVYVRCNGDTAANYDDLTYFINNTGVSEANEYGNTFLPIGYFTGANAPSGVPGFGAATVQDYRGTTFHKSVLADGMTKEATSGTNLYRRGVIGWWKSTAAVTSLTVGVSAGNMVSGCVISLYGRY